MKKKISIILLVILCTLLFAGCECEHEWVEASCDAPKTCALCKATDGAPLGHSWMAATCEMPKTCEVCGLEQGDVQGHNWVEATCDTPKHCLNCEATEGTALAHAWQKATTEAPKTCAACGVTEGERIITDARFTTAANQALFGTWEVDMTMTGEELDMGEFVEEVPFVAALTFGEDGDLAIEFRFKDLDAFLSELRRNTVELMYKQFEDMDMTREEADDVFVSAYGMSVADYATSIWAVVNWENLFDVYNVHYVYYADGEQLYIANRWDGNFISGTFLVEGDQLTVCHPELSGGELTVMTRVEIAE